MFLCVAVLAGVPMCFWVIDCCVFRFFFVVAFGGWFCFVWYYLVSFLLCYFFFIFFSSFKFFLFLFLFLFIFCFRFLVAVVACASVSYCFVVVCCGVWFWCSACGVVVE